MRHDLSSTLVVCADKDSVASKLGTSAIESAIPGLDFDTVQQPTTKSQDVSARKKVPYAKPVPKDFQLAWTEGKQPLSIQQQTPVENGNSSTASDKQSGPPSTGRIQYCAQSSGVASFALEL